MQKFQKVIYIIKPVISLQYMGFDWIYERNSAIILTHFYIVCWYYSLVKRQMNNTYFNNSHHNKVLLSLLVIGPCPMSSHLMLMWLFQVTGWRRMNLAVTGGLIPFSIRLSRSELPGKILNVTNSNQYGYWNRNSDKIQLFKVFHTLIVEIIELNWKIATWYRSQLFIIQFSRLYSLSGTCIMWRESRAIAVSCNL